MKKTKRIFDFVCAFIGLILLSPLLLVVALFNRLLDGGPVFYLQKRVGYKGKSFSIWKFRTMNPDAEKNGPSLTIGRDKRVTQFGYFLRRYKIDELPQLINVLIGDMSFVGPRPEVKKYVSKYSPEQKKVLDLVPGITDLASIRFRNESEELAKQKDPESYYVNVVMPEKIRLNLEYHRKNSSIVSDIKIIFKTLYVSLFG